MLELVRRAEGAVPLVAMIGRLGAAFEAGGSRADIDASHVAA